jgi:hypothetical protein
MSSSKLPSISLYKRIAVSFLVLTIILIFVISYFSCGKSVIKIETVRQRNTVEFFADFGQRSEATEALANLIPAKILETTIEDKKNFLATGKKSIEKEGNVVGTITVQNNTSQGYNFVRRTRFLSADGLLFRMDSPAAIPANGSVKVEVYPDDEDFTGVLNPTTFTIPGLSSSKQKLVYGVTDKPLVKGGEDVYFVTKEDVENARQEMEGQLKMQALSELQESLKFRARLFNEATQVEIVKEVLEPKVGDVSESFDLSLKAKVVALSLDKIDFENEMEIQIKEQLLAGRELLNFDPEKIVYTLEKYDPQGQIITFKISYNTETGITKNNKIFNKSNLIGLEESEVIDYFMGFEDVKSVKVDFSPFWVKRVPNLIDRIELILVK